MTARPAPGVVTGYAVGAAIALYPNQLPRSVAVQAPVTVVFALVGAAVGWAMARRRASWTVARYLLPAALVGWLLWQNHLRAAAGVDAVSPLAFAALVAAVIVPAALLVAGRRPVTAALAALLVVCGLAAPAAAAAPSQAQRFAAIESRTPGVRAYAALSDGATPAERARVAVDRLIAAGGLTRRVVAVALPTGSGWVDAQFVRGLEQALGGDTAIVSVQYTAMPSWQAFLLHRDAAATAGAALIDELHRRAPSTPLRLYGQSLGAVGVVAAQRRAAEIGQPIAATLQVGTPASVPVVGDAQLNGSDPVGILSWRLAVAPPSRTPDGGRATPRPPWLPVISLLQAAVDLLGATDQPSGLGHRYDERQGTELVRDLGSAPTRP